MSNVVAGIPRMDDMLWLLLVLVEVVKFNKRLGDGLYFLMQLGNVWDLSLKEEGFVVGLEEDNEEKPNTLVELALQARVKSLLGTINLCCDITLLKPTIDDGCLKIL